VDYRPSEGLEEELEPAITGSSVKITTTLFLTEAGKMALRRRAGHPPQSKGHG
jgi:hypothetical protein